MATVIAQQLQEFNWGWKDFPHTLWSQAILEVNGQIVIPEQIEFGVASTGQQVLIVTFDDESKLNVWLDPDFPRKRLQDYAVWEHSPFYDLTLSTCPAWRIHRCSRCSVNVEVWDPPNELVVDLKFCERTDHRRMPATPHARLVIRNRGFTQKRFGLEE